MRIDEVTVLSFHVDFATREGVATCFLGERGARAEEVGIRVTLSEGLGMLLRKSLERDIAVGLQAMEGSEKNGDL